MSRLQGMPTRTDHVPQYRFRGQISPQEAEQRGARSEDLATANGNTAVLRIFDVIDSWGGFWGISANEVLSALDELGDGIGKIELHINSPGGEATEGVAIYNALVNHPAQVDVVIDGLAASAASLVAMAGDTVTMASGTEMMIHLPWNIAMGNAEDIRKTADVLDHLADNLASVYAERAGGTKASWLKVMADETWYNPDEALAAGLATGVTTKRSRSASNMASASFDLSVFNYAGRANAPTPSLFDTNNRTTRANLRDRSTQGSNSMDEAQLALIGLAKGASDDEIKARLEALAAAETSDDDGDGDDDPAVDPAGTDVPDGTTPPTPAQPGGVQDPAAPAPEVAPGTPAAPETASPENSFAVPESAVVIDKAALASLQKTQAEFEQMKAKNAQKEVDDFLGQAQRDGKFPRSQQKHYKNLMKTDPVNTKALIDSFPKNTVPVEEIGRGQDSELDGNDDSYPTAGLSVQERQRIQLAHQGA